MSRTVAVYTFTPADAYATVRDLQQVWVKARIQGQVGDMLLVGSHPPVITQGRRTQAAHMPSDSMGIPCVDIERGGSVTYHGPGQLVLYPVFALESAERNLHQVLRRLEDAIIHTLAEFDILGAQSPDGTGVWVGPRKIASIGLAVRHWVIYHGLALNVTTDLTPFHAMQPCGLPGMAMTRMLDECPEGILPDMTAISASLTTHVLTQFEGVSSGPPVPISAAWSLLARSDYACADSV